MSVDEFLNRDRPWTRSRQWLKAAAAITPPGSQTNAKRPTELLMGAGPNYFARADGCRVWDIDDNEYVDFCAALGPIILGHRYAPVEEAVTAQREKGVIFSLPSPLEAELAGRLVELFDWASWARFFKSGSDANSAAVRVARAHTGRDMVLSCGYNGWDEWWVAKFHNTKGWARTDGVPKVLGELVRDVGYAGIPQLEQLFDQYGDQIACIIAVPAFEDRPLDVQFLRRARQLTDQHRCLLIFDEVKTGFRLSLHGAGSIAGVEPDISTFAKAVANGYPIAALLGRKYLGEMLNRCMITGTYNGELLSMAAAMATLDCLQNGDVYSHLQRLGASFMGQMRQLADGTGLPIRVDGHPAVFCLVFEGDDEQRCQQLHNRFYLSLMRQGVYSRGSFELSYSHGDQEVEIALEATKRALAKL